MTVLKRSILLGLSLLLLFMSIPYVMFENIHTHISQTQIIFYIILSSVIALHNFFMIYKQATTIHVVVVSDKTRKRIETIKGDDQYV